MTSPGPINRPSFWYFRVNRFARWNSALPGDDVTGLTNRWRGLGHHVPRDAARQGVRAAVPDDEVLPSQALAVTVTECPKAALWERPPLSTWAFPPSRRPSGFARPSRYAPPLIAIAWQWWIASSGDPDPADSARTITAHGPLSPLLGTVSHLAVSGIMRLVTFLSSYGHRTSRDRGGHFRLLGKRGRRLHFRLRGDDTRRERTVADAADAVTSHKKRK